MERAEIERFKRRLELLEPTEENLERVAAARGNPVDPRMLNEEVREMTARFLLLETNSPVDPGRAFRAALFLDSGNGDVSKEILADTAENRSRLYRDPTQAEDEVLSAAIRGDDKKLFRLVAEGAGLNAKDENGMTPLMHCISRAGSKKCTLRKDRLSSTRLLLLAGANPNEKNNRKANAGHFAKMNVDVEAFSMWGAFAERILFYNTEDAKMEDLVQIFELNAEQQREFERKIRCEILNLLIEKDCDKLRKLGSMYMNMLQRNFEICENFLEPFTHGKGKNVCYDVETALTWASLGYCCQRSVSLQTQLGAYFVERDGEYEEYDATYEQADIEIDKLEKMVANGKRGIFSEPNPKFIPGMMKVLFSDEKTCAEFGFGRFVEIASEQEPFGFFEFSPDPNAIRIFADAAVALLSEKPEMFDTLVLVISKFFKKGMEKHFDDPEVESSVGMLVGALAAVSEDMPREESVVI